MNRSNAVANWLFFGCFLVLVQILIGGITRLTDSGLSITEWEVVKGTLPPLNQSDWIVAFDKYKSIAKKQYESIHNTMDLAAFKKIYFWEYFHRLWARMMGLVFIIPFLYFTYRKRLSSDLIQRLRIVIFLASLAGIFGWIMVASGLNNDKRTWVNAYNLLIHLIIATTLFCYLVYTYYNYRWHDFKGKVELNNLKVYLCLGIFLFIQVGFGAIMAGMKAGLVLPYPFLIPIFPKISQMIATAPALDWKAFIDYEPNPLIKIVVQFVHRLTAYIIVGLALFFYWKNRGLTIISKPLKVFSCILTIQIILGILTVSFSIGKIPLVYGVVHQGTAFILLASYLWILFRSKSK
ncbi:MAG: COX15/CtaA family protein [Chitinophagales bacterium]